MRSKDEVCDGNIEGEFMSGMKFGWNIRWDELSRGTAKWNQKMKSVLQTANEMETEMVTLLYKGGTVKWNQKMKTVLQTANEMETEMVTLLCKGRVCDANCRWDEN